MDMRWGRQAEWDDSGTNERTGPPCPGGPSCDDGRCHCPMGMDMGIRLEFRFHMMISEPNTTRPTTNTPKASASTLLVESGALLMCRKNTRCTPIWAIASTASRMGMAGVQTCCVDDAQKDASVSA